MPNKTQIMFTLISYFTSLMLIPFATSSPTLQNLEVRAGIPGPPADPPQKPGDGSGQWRAPGVSCDLNDIKIEEELRAGVIAYDTILQRPEAARCMSHYLANTGTDLNMNLANMMQDMPDFKDKVGALAADSAKAAVAGIGTDTTQTFVSPWTLWSAWNPKTNAPYSLDWYYAMGDFSYSVSGLVTVGKSGVMSLQWTAHIFDRYNWDNSGKTFSFKKTLPLNIVIEVDITHAEIGHLHKCGSAREYTNRGTSIVQNVPKYDPSKPLPAVDTSGAVGPDSQDGW